MSEYYHNFLSSVSGVGGNPELYPPASAPSIPSPTSFGMGGTTGPNSLQSVTYYPGLPEQIIQYQPSKSQRNRRKTASGPDHIKHRRTRSGCFTCRGRRVKCDETRPICERCRKGKRDCQYPEPSPTSKSSSSQGSRDVETSQRSPTSSNEDEDDVDQDTRLTPIPDEDEEDSSNTIQQPSQPSRSLRRINTASSLNLMRLTSRSRQSSETLSQDRAQSSSPTISSGTATSFTPTTMSLPDSLGSAKLDWTHLPPEFQTCLDYFYENITHYHYGVHRDSADFFHTSFLKWALRSEALLHAVVGFAAYQQTLKDSNGRIQDFLKYYTHAVTLLLELLKKDEMHDLGTLLTILQLATIEEYFGDWINLMGHQKAALQIINQLFTPQRIIQTPMGRTILIWYTRFDLFVSSMGSFEPSLPRPWIEALNAQSQAQLSNDPESLHWLSETTENWMQLIFLDMCSLYSRQKSGLIAEEAFLAEHKRLTILLREWRDSLDPRLTDPAHLATIPVTEHQLFNYANNRAPIYEGYWSFMTILLAEWHAVALIHLCHVSGNSLAETSELLGNLSQNAEAICQTIEGAENWPPAPKGMLSMLHPSLSLAAIWLPRTPQKYIWLRKKFAWLESSGYIFPKNMRVRMARILEDETARRWWLPNDQGFTPILQNVRAFVDERNHSASSIQPEHLRETSDLFDTVVHRRAQEDAIVAESIAE